MRSSVAVVLWALLLSGPVLAQPANISQKVGVCDPLFGARCVKPATDGSIPVTQASGATDKVDVSKVNGAAVDVGVGAASTGTQRVAVSSNSSLTANAGTNLNTSALALDASVVASNALAAAFTGVTNMPVDATTYTAGRSLEAECTVAGAVKVTFSDASQRTINVAVGDNIRPYAVTAWTVSGVSGPATCTYANLK